MRMLQEGRGLRYAVAFSCAVWVMIYAAWQGSAMMMTVGVGMVLLTLLTVWVEVRRMKRSGEWWRTEWKEDQWK